MEKPDVSEEFRRELEKGQADLVPAVAPPAKDSPAALAAAIPCVVTIKRKKDKGEKGKDKKRKKSKGEAPAGLAALVQYGSDDED